MRIIEAQHLESVAAGLRTILPGLVLGSMLAGFAVGSAMAQDDELQRVDYLTFAQGAIPLSLGGAGASLGADFEAAVRIADGDPGSFTVVNRAPPDADTEFVYELPALTTFDRFAVPGITETPSPIATFTATVEVLGSATGPDADYVLLSAATLQTHAGRGEVTELEVLESVPVRWVKLRLTGGINVMEALSSFEFSEIIGNGVQDSPELATHFTGSWRRSALNLRLEQDGPLVTGCYDNDGVLNGTVTGNLLRATGASAAGNPSAFIFGITDDGNVRGVRSANNGPFRLYELAAVEASDPRLCGAPPPPAIGCGSILHGITFGFDSADIRPESDAVLAALHAGLAADAAAGILIEGHTSSEGSEAYNQQLSERRAAAVVEDLVARGIGPDRITAAGIGELRPIASNADESGRSLNRRVEVHCR